VLELELVVLISHEVGELRYAVLASFPHAIHPYNKNSIAAQSQLQYDQSPSLSYPYFRTLPTLPRKFLFKSKPALICCGSGLNGFRSAKGLELESLQGGRDSISVTAE
jgi:hypothetical protein